MATIQRDGDRLRVQLSTREKIVALRGDVAFPVAAVSAIDVATDPLATVEGVRAPGLHLPGRTKIGTWRHRGRQTFAVARAGTPAVRIDLHGHRYDTVVISVPDAEAVARSLRVEAG